MPSAHPSLLARVLGAPPTPLSCGLGGAIWLLAPAMGLGCGSVRAAEPAPPSTLCAPTGDPAGAHSVLASQGAAGGVLVAWQEGLSGDHPFRLCNVAPDGSATLLLQSAPLPDSRPLWLRGGADPGLLVQATTEDGRGALSWVTAHGNTPVPRAAEDQRSAMTVDAATGIVAWMRPVAPGGAVPVVHVPMEARSTGEAPSPNPPPVMASGEAILGRWADGKITPLGSLPSLGSARNRPQAPALAVADSGDVWVATPRCGVLMMQEDFGSYPRYLNCTVEVAGWVGGRARNLPSPGAYTAGPLLLAAAGTGPTVAWGGSPGAERHLVTWNNAGQSWIEQPLPPQPGELTGLYLNPLRIVARSPTEEAAWIHGDGGWTPAAPPLAPALPHGATPGPEAALGWVGGVLLDVLPGAAYVDVWLLRGSADGWGASILAGPAVSKAPSALVLRDSSDMYKRNPPSLGWSGAPGGPTLSAILLQLLDSDTGWAMLLSGPAGDVSGDGVVDLVTVEQGGRISLYDGTPGRTRLIGVGRPVKGLLLGARAAGDLDSDGYADLVVTTGDAPGVVIVAGGPHGYVDTRTVALGPTPTYYHADGLGAGRDVTGDTLPDVVIADPQTRKLLIYAGDRGALPSSPIATLDFSRVARWSDPTPKPVLTLLGDTDHDGLGELALGLPGAAVQAVHVFEARSRGWPGRPQRELDAPTGGREYANFGQDVEPVGDLDGDGFEDVAVLQRTGQPGDAWAEGAVCIYPGGPDGLAREPAQVLVPPDIYRIGRRIITPGDLTGDGVPDLVVEVQPVGGVVALLWAGGSELATQAPRPLSVPGW